MTMLTTTAVVATITRGSTDMTRQTMHIPLLYERRDDVINKLISPHQHMNGRAKSAEQNRNASIFLKVELISTGQPHWIQCAALWLYNHPMLQCIQCAELINKW